MSEFRLSYDPGLKRDLVQIFRRAVGRENAIPRGQLLHMLGQWQDGAGFERTVRAAIVDLRNEGFLICSTGGREGGYWLAESWGELIEFVEREYHSRAMSMLATEKAMRAAARNQWGPEQHRMF